MSKTILMSLAMFIATSAFAVTVGDPTSNIPSPSAYQKMSEAQAAKHAAKYLAPKKFTSKTKASVLDDGAYTLSDASTGCSVNVIVEQVNSKQQKVTPISAISCS